MCFGLSVKQAIVLDILLRRGVAHLETILDAVYPSRHPASGNALVSSSVRAIRKSLEPLDVEVRSIHSFGYGITAEGIRIVLSKINEERPE